MCLCLSVRALSTEAGGHAVSQADAGAQLPLPELRAALRQPLTAIPVTAAGIQRRVLERRQGQQVCL